MKILRTRLEVSNAMRLERSKNKTIGLVPTMGALHNGHLRIIEKSKLYSDITVATIYVNPTQFNNSSDLDNYPRPWQTDLRLLEVSGVDYVFLPTDGEMYPQKVELKFDFGHLETILEGKFRPGHFNGVGIIVSKLFNIIQPDHSYFGQKDLQQLAVIRRLVKDLSYNIELIKVPTIREQSGLAMSSRNVRLNEEERRTASILYTCLTYAKDELLKGQDWLVVKEKVTAIFMKEPLSNLEYFELVKSDTLEMTSDLQVEGLAICTAAYIGDVRLIDNMIIN
ncbi:pantoate--beta-alanine ligase [Anditalea andensis]|uniref:Pantothenate synthetase n=1 Tax=Anditalea andensis TaxID=1048983 RepID=A0A074LEA6_9BACT|nr:pantoate--beta-alanine ligase [Anditalea andensis]KEO72097.1 pantoate--beta-alanine ligase [Anditalea andensis]